VTFLSWPDLCGSLFHSSISCLTQMGVVAQAVFRYRGGGEVLRDGGLVDGGDDSGDLSSRSPG